MSSVAIVGAGITGLAAAHRLRQIGLPVTIYEAGTRVGGVIQSIRQEGYLAEAGPNSILETSPKISELVNELGLEDRRLYTDPAADKRYIVRGGGPVAMPSSAGEFLMSPLFSAAAKARLALEPFIPRAAPEHEESIGAFVLRRLGREFLDYAINPFVAGIYAGDPMLLSVRHAFPKLHALEQKYGSLLIGQVLGARERRRRQEISKQNAKKFSFDGGLQTLTHALHQELGDRVRLRSKVTALRESRDGWTVTVDKAGEPAALRHSSVLLTSPAGKLADLSLETTRGDISLALLGEIFYPPVASVVMGFRREDIGHPLDGFGMLVPEVERFSILGTIFSSSLFPSRAPAGHVTLTSYIGGCRAPELARLEPESLFELVQRDLRLLLQAKAEPTFRHAAIFPEAIPQYEIGYGRFKDFMEQTERLAPGLFFAGHYRDGIALSDSILAGLAAADRIAKRLAQSPPPRDQSSITSLSALHA